MCLKGLIAAAFESSEPLHFLRLNGVSAPSLHRESTDSLIEALLKYPRSGVPLLLLRLDWRVGAIITYRVY